MKKVLLTLVVLAVLIGAAVGVVYAMGYKVAVIPSACGEDAVNQFNKVYLTALDPQATKDKKATFEDLYNSVKKKGNFQNDPTCRYIEFVYAQYIKKDKALMQSAYAVIERENKIGRYVDGRFELFYSVQALKSQIEALDAMQKQSESGDAAQQ